MKKKVLFGSLLAVFLLMMLPTVSAIESDAVKETMRSQYPIIIPDIDFDELKFKYQNGPEPWFFLIFLLQQILNLLRVIKFSIPLILLYLIIKEIIKRLTNGNDYRPYLEVETQSDTMIFYPSDDTFVNQRHPDETKGDSIKLEVATWDGEGSSDDWERDLLIRFDLSSIPSGSSIISAKLYIYYFSYDDTDPVGRDLSLYRVTNDWDEDTVTWNTKPPYVPDESSVAIVPSVWSWMNWDVTSDVKNFVNGSEINYGWHLMDEGTWNQGNIPVPRFCSKEYVD